MDKKLETTIYNGFLARCLLVEVGLIFFAQAPSKFDRPYWRDPHRSFSSRNPGFGFRVYRVKRV